MTRKRSYKITLFFIVVVIILFWKSLPDPLFNDGYSTVLISAKDELLGAYIANDGQWRFPEIDTVPEKFAIAITTFEDKRFYYHGGIDPFALIRALIINISTGNRVSGASTLTMQVIRLSRKGKSRTIKEKIIEMYLAFRLECSSSKEEILSLYASHAPFGGNVVGIEAAAWRYFGRTPNELSWSESCLMAVLPNSPALIHPGKNRKELIIKRNNLLKKLFKEGIISMETYQLSVIEPIPEKPKAFPQLTPHLLMRYYTENKGKNVESKIRTTIDLNIQKKADFIISEKYKDYSGNGINNMAALIVEVESGEVVSYSGNISNFSLENNGNHVDIITSNRSSGSILKPFLYAAMLTDGDILPNTLVPDIPTNIDGYNPKNYNLSNDGAVPAKRALARSLNIPAVRMLRDYGIQKFIHVLQKAGLTSIDKSADHYGLSLILGGCEANLWDLCGAYASMARSLNHFAGFSGQYNSCDYFPPEYIYDREKQKRGVDICKFSVFSASAIWFTFNAMLDVERPTDKSNWEQFTSSRKIAWKTGTSFGFRDGWAIGITPDYVIGVWVGNADGEGRPNLTGLTTAAPVLFELFEILPVRKSWFDPPYDDMEKVAVCKRSGYLASEICDEVDTLFIPVNGLRFKKCPYHQIVHLDQSEKYRVHSDCEEPSNMIHIPWFVLPPAMEWYFKSKNSFYKSLPPYRPDCIETMKPNNTKSMEIIYPKDPTKIYVPIELNENVGKTVFEVAHRNPNTTIYWHIDDEYIGETKSFHQMAVSPSKGKHVLTLLDENGEKVTQIFEIISKSQENEKK
ncbi:MAG: penicillin-binding protein 1C [Bacteroidota bacterium]